MNTFYQRAFMAFTILASQSVLAESMVEWSNLTAAGNGCPAGSALITATPDGSELAWTSNTFGYSLSGESSASRFCRLSGSAAIARGYYLDEVRQQMSYGGFKSRAGTELNMGAQARFLGFNLQPLTRAYPDGSSFNAWKVTVRRAEKFSPLAPAEYFCGQEPRSGLFQGTVASSAIVNAPEGEVFVGIQGLTVSYKANFKWLPCPS